MLETVAKLEKEERLAARHEELCRLLKEGLDDMRNGRVAPAEDVMKRSRELLKTMR